MCNKGFKIYFFLYICSVFLCVSCVKPLEKKEEKKSEMTESEKLQAVYDGFGSEPKDYVQQDQLAEGLRWYPDADETSFVEIENPVGFSDVQSKNIGVKGAKAKTSFLLSIYESGQPKSIVLSYALDKAVVDEWKVFYEVESLRAEEIELLVDYQDLNLFKFDYYLPPELLKFTFTWLIEKKQVKHDLYIDPRRQAKDVHVKGDKSKGIISKGVFGSKTLVVKNLSGVTYQVSIIYKDDRDGESKNMPVEIATKVTRLIQIPEFMGVESVVVNTKQNEFTKTLSMSDIFLKGALESCVLLDFKNDQSSVNVANMQDFSVCFDGEKDYSAWILSLMPEMAVDEDAEPEVPTIKGL